MTGGHPEHGPLPARRKWITAEEFLRLGPENLGRVEIIAGRIVRVQAQSELHSRVVRRLAAAFEQARPDGGPCMTVSSDSAVRLKNHQSGKLNAVYPDVYIRDCEPYDVNTVRDHILLVAEVTSEGTIDNDLEGTEDAPGKISRYARNSIPVYLVVLFDKTWTKIEQIDEYRLDWSGVRYRPERIHTERLVLEDPVKLTITFTDLLAN